MDSLERFWEQNGIAGEEKERASAILAELDGCSIVKARELLDLCKGAVMLTKVNYSLERRT